MRNITTALLRKLTRKKFPFGIKRGKPFPLGSSLAETGVNFCVYCKSEKLTLLLVKPGKNRPSWELELQPGLNRTGDLWHILVQELPENIRYGYRVGEGKNASVLLDPYARLISGGNRWGKSHGAKSERYSFVVDLRTNGVSSLGPGIALKDSIIYEMHVRGFTRHPSSKVKARGSYRGVVEKIPYFKELGITAVELLPICEFDENDNSFRNPRTGKPLKNFWGYNTIGFFASKASYASHGGKSIEEFRDMVNAFHRAGIEVILDMVFNHTAEGGQNGPCLHFKGLAKSVYYILDKSGNYLNFSGCGNTVSCNHPVMSDLIVDCLRYWTVEMGVDGFRFDLASILTRDKNGRPLENPPIVERIAEDPVLAHTKLIAEPWDCGLYQVGSFPSYGRWADWNGKFRDDVRCFMRGDNDSVFSLAMRFCGSPDIFDPRTRFPWHSVNFITCHDGFTLWDLVSYNHKHNESNGEKNKDGSDENFSWNCGNEGDTIDPEILRLRYRQMKNFMAILLLSQGVPMLPAGDEFARTQKGNNNAYCQDNETSWIDWQLAELNCDLLRFTREMIAFRKRHPVLRQKEFITTTSLKGRGIEWHGVKIGQPDWGYHSHSLAFVLEGSRVAGDRDIYVAVNAYWKPLAFEIPPAPSGKAWLVFADTGLLPPYDIVPELKNTRYFEQNLYKVLPRSLIVMVSE